MDFLDEAIGRNFHPVLNRMLGERFQMKTEHSTWASSLSRFILVYFCHQNKINVIQQIELLALTLAIGST
jgi:hypothetical protein